MAVGLPGPAGETGTVIGPEPFSDGFTPIGFDYAVNEQLRAGAAMLLIDESIHPESTGRKELVMEAEPPGGV